MRRPIHVMLAAWSAVFAPWTMPRANAQRVLDPPPNSELNESVVRLPLSVVLANGRMHAGEMVLTIFKPEGDGPFPIIITSHGRGLNRAEFGRARTLGPFFVRRGFAVIAPTRIGYGLSGADVDPEWDRAVRDDQCDTWQYGAVARNVTAHIDAAIAYAATQPWADRQRIVLAGVSAGGFGSLIAASELAHPVRAVISFAGGIGGKIDTRPEQPCNPEDVSARLARAATNTSAPSLWIYAENDQQWGAFVPRLWHSAYTKAGGRAEFLMLPPLGADGHDIVDPGLTLWTPAVERFLGGLGVAPRLLPDGSPPPSTFARLDDAKALPGVDAAARTNYSKFLASSVPRAFAIGADGSWSWSAGTLKAIQTALANCRKRSAKNAPCKLYAVNDEIVWRP